MKRKEKERRGMEQLPQVLVEEILQRLGVKSLVRFTSVSKQWNSSIKSTSFASAHLIRARSRDPHILIASESSRHDSKPYSNLLTLELGSSELKKIHNIPKPNRFCSLTGSCDGLVCVYDFLNFIYIINPATRWSRSLPQAKIQQVNRARRKLDREYPSDRLAFGKDTMTGKYKLVWFYNSFEQDLHCHPTCEVFDFSTNTWSWRYVFGSTHLPFGSPVYLDGSLHWLAIQMNGEREIIYFDLHTEQFQVMVEIPIVHASPRDIIMCSLNDRLCVSEKKSNSQEIWSLNSHKVWEKTYSINLSVSYRLLGAKSKFSITPVTVFNKTELLLRYPFTNCPCVLVQDTRIASYSLYSIVSNLDEAISYIPSLISIIN